MKNGIACSGGRRNDLVRSLEKPLPRSSGGVQKRDPKSTARAPLHRNDAPLLLHIQPRRTPRLIRQVEPQLQIRKSGTEKIHKHFDLAHSQTPRPSSPGALKTIAPSRTRRIAIEAFTSDKSYQNRSAQRAGRA